MSEKRNPKTLSHLELAEFTSQMGLMLCAGISSQEALQLLLDDAANEEERSMLSQLLEESETTGSFFHAAKASGVFPNYALSMLRLGEETGTLDTVMNSLSSHYTRESNLANMIRSALVYPSIMLLMMFLIILVLLTQIMPIFQQVFQQLGQEMNGFSSTLLFIGETLSRYSLLFIVLTAGLVLLLIFGRKHLPFQKRLNEQIAICRFADGMSIILKSGLTPEEGLNLVSDLIENDTLKQKLVVCRQLMENGSGLAQALQESQILKGTYARMALIASKAGVLDETMEQIASEYEYGANAKITSFIALLEPTLVIILSLIVGVILFSVMLPLLGIMSGL